MITMRSRGLWLLLLGVMTGLLALAGLTAVALAGPRQQAVRPAGNR